MSKTVMFSFILALCVAGNLPASGMDMGHMHDGVAQQAESEGVGVIDEIDGAKGVLTISHEPIATLGWPAMTMDFVVKDKKMLGNVSKGKKVRFAFVQQHGDYLITKIK